MRRRPHPVVVELKAERIRRGLTLRDLYDLCGLAPATVSAWETGHRSPNLRSLDVYAQTVHRPILTGPAEEVPGA